MRLRYRLWREVIDMKNSKNQTIKISEQKLVDILDFDDVSEIEPIEDAWSGNLDGEAKNLALNIDHPKAAGSEATTKEPEMLPKQESQLEESNEKFSFRDMTRQFLDGSASAEKTELILEANPDGTISPNEDLEREDFLDEVSAQIDDLLEDIRKRAAEIGGPFRAPGIRAQAKDILISAIKAFGR